MPSPLFQSMSVLFSPPILELILEMGTTLLDGDTVALPMLNELERCGFCCCNTPVVWLVGNPGGGIAGGVDVRGLEWLLKPIPELDPL